MVKNRGGENGMTFLGGENGISRWLYVKGPFLEVVSYLDFFLSSYSLYSYFFSLKFFFKFFEFKL